MLSLDLLGPPHLAWQGTPFDPPPPKVLALLAYLALQDEPVNRRDLSELLWGTSKSGSIRMALSTLRTLPGVETWLETPDQLVRVRADVDVRRFEEALRQGRYAEALAAWPNGEATLLLGLELRRADDFDLWLEEERTRLSALVQQALRGRATELERAGDLEGALALAPALLARDPLDEGAHRIVMRLEHARGNTDSALAQFALCRSLLKEEVGVEPSAETLALLREIEQGGTTRAKRAQLLSRAEEVPTLPERLIGRDALFARAIERLERGERLLLHGFGGTGKSALAASLAAARLGARGGRVLWLEVGDDDLETLFDALAAAFGARRELRRVAAGARPRALHDLLIAQEIDLLVLDDVWSAYALARLLEALPRELPLLVTARQRYPGLTRLDVGRLQRAASLELLALHAGRELDDAAADGLCDLLGDHPFALRIAGVTLALDDLAPATLLARIEEAPHALASPAEFADSGRESVAALLEVTVDTLSDESYEILTAFGALFTSSATSTLLALLVRRDEDEVDGALIGLQQRALAERVAEPGSDVIAYRLHDLVHSYARSNSNLRTATVLRGCHAFTERHREAFELLDAEIPNLLSAVQIAADRGDAGYLVAMMRLLVTGAAYFTARGHTPRSLALLEAASAAARDADDLEAAHYLLARLGNSYHQFDGDLDRALAAYREAFDLARKRADRHREAIMLSLVGAVEAERKADGAHTLLERAYRLAHESGDDLALSHVLQNRSYVAGIEGDDEAALRYCRESVETLQRLHDNPSADRAWVDQELFYSLFNLGVAASRLEREDEAFETYGRARTFAEERDNRLWTAYALQEIGELHHRRNERAEAQRHFDRALELYRQNRARSDIEELTDLMRAGGYDLEEGTGVLEQRDRPE